MSTRVCPTCRVPMDEDEIAKLTTAKELEEFHVTGMCKSCQENIYGPAFGEKQAMRGGYVTGSDNSPIGRKIT